MNDQVRLNSSYDPPPIGVQVQSLVSDLRDDGRLMRHFVLTLIMTVALFAFEIFNFDTTRYALDSLIGNVRFLGFTWATILAIAFCAIDFAGLFRLFAPESDKIESKYVAMLMGAWLLGATMNAIMTWWAVTLTLLENPYGNAILSADVLLKVVPLFVAVLVWLTRVLFIGALNYSGEQFVAMRRTTDGGRLIEVPVLVVEESEPQPVRLKEKMGHYARSRQPSVRVSDDDATQFFGNRHQEEQPTLIQQPRPSGRPIRPKTISGLNRPNGKRTTKNNH
jgi:hypothetical protein